MVSDILIDIVYDISQAGFIPPLDKEAAGIITGSEAIFKEFASKHSLSASKSWTEASAGMTDRDLAWTQLPRN